jgi:hypothetical protein
LWDIKDKVYINNPDTEKDQKKAFCMMCLEIHQQNLDVKQVACVLGVTLICEPQEIISVPSVNVVSENVT